MRGSSKLVLAIVVLAVMIGCSARQTYMVPPRIDLKQHEMIGVIEFDSSEEGELGSLATRRFKDASREDQGLVRMVDLGPEQDALVSVGKRALNSDAFKALGQTHRVQTIVVGELTVSNIRPDLSIATTIESGSLTASVDATLAVQMIEATSGASIWSTSASATRSIGGISVFRGGKFVFNAEDPERAYGDLIDYLVAQVTRDFQVTWERR
jgi:hypothetical protein